MKKNIIIWGFAVILAVIAIFVTSKSKIDVSGINQISSASTINQSVPSLISGQSRQKAIDFTLTDLNGNSVSLKKFRGKNVYINFWTTWCPWCKKELPDIEKISQEYKDKNLVVLTVDIGEDKATVGNFIKENNYDFNVLLDSDSSVAQQYSISSIPVSIFIDKNGNIAQKNVGAMSENQMKAIIENLLVEKK